MNKSKQQVIEMALEEYKRELELGLEENMFTWHIYKNAYLKGYNERGKQEPVGETFSNGRHPRSEFSSGAGFREM